MLLVIGGLAFALASAVAVVVVRALRRWRLAESKRREESERLKGQEPRRRVEEESGVAAEQEGQRKAGAEACIAAAQEARRKAEAESRIRLEEEARAAAAQQAKRRADEDARLRADEAAVAAAQEAQRKAEEQTRRRAEAEARVTAEQEAQRNAEEGARLRADEEARVAAAQEAQRMAAAEKARIVAAHAKDQARTDMQGDGHRSASEGARTNVAPALATGSGATNSSGAAPENPAITRVPLPIAAVPVSATVDIPAPDLRAPRQYRPLARVPAAPRDAPGVSTEREPRERAMPIEVRLVFEKAGFCRVSLLPRRAEGMPTELVMTGSGDPPELLALQDEWYQDVVLPNLGQLLREGIEWAGSLPELRRVRASLSGREIYVLARHNEIAGFVSAPRLVLGEEHVVLSVTERLAEVRAAIALTGSTDPVLLSADSGIPPGWAGLRGIVPRNPIAPSPTGEILDALRPLGDVEIALVGGVRIDRQTWLTGFPPSVRLRGDTSTRGAVTIDGHEATVTSEGDYTAPGWDSPGDHSIWCTSDSRTYSIRRGAEEWQAWDAYTWSLGELAAEATRSRPGICGVLVRPPKAGRSDGRAIVVPASNPVLIGAAPGEIEICAPRSDMRAELRVGFPWFEPIWAIPADALRCDKRNARVLLIGSPQSVEEGKQQPNSRPTRRRNRGAHAWCEAILTAGRKGLQTEPSRAEIADLWRAYKRSAKTLRRRWR